MGPPQRTEVVLGACGRALSLNCPRATAAQALLPSVTTASPSSQPPVCPRLVDWFRRWFAQASPFESRWGRQPHEDAEGRMRTDSDLRARSVSCVPLHPPRSGTFSTARARTGCEVGYGLSLETAHFPGADLPILRRRGPPFSLSSNTDSEDFERTILLTLRTVRLVCSSQRISAPSSSFS